MHLIIPHASVCAEGGQHVLSDLQLPRLQDLLGLVATRTRLGEDEFTLTPPHEHALAQAWSWHGADGCLPFAAQSAAHDGVAVGERAWGQLTPVHWHVSSDHVSLADPALLQLSEQDSRTLFEAVRYLFEDLGWTLAWGAPQRWYCAHDSLEGLPTASLDRAVGRNIDLWLPDHPQGRAVRRLQNEVQMLLYKHPLNDSRQANGLLPVNSFWLSGCGRAQAGPDRLASASIRVDERLRESALRQDWAAWAEAWQALDGSALADLLARVRRGEPARLSVCGERQAQCWELRPRRLWQRIAGRWRGPSANDLLRAL